MGWQVNENHSECTTAPWFHRLPDTQTHTHAHTPWANASRAALDRRNASVASCSPVFLSPRTPVAWTTDASISSRIRFASTVSWWGIGSQRKRHPENTSRQIEYKSINADLFLSFLFFSCLPPVFFFLVFFCLVSLRFTSKGLLSCLTCIWWTYAYCILDHGRRNPLGQTEQCSLTSDSRWLILSMTLHKYSTSSIIKK